MLRTGELNLGNLGNLALLRVRTNVVIGPRDVVRRLHTEGETGAPVAFARSRGNAYLVRAGNPKGIRSVADLLQPDVVPFMSNPDTEAASYGVYRETMLATARIRDHLRRRRWGYHRRAYRRAPHLSAHHQGADVYPRPRERSP